jgi:CBS domain-containing protein
METTLPKKALKPFVAIGKEATVIEAIRAMVDKRVGAVVVLEEGRLLGIFTERDVLIRVVLEGRDSAKTRASDVMTTGVKTVREDTDRKLARRLMVDNHIRHLPVVDAEGKVVSMLSMRHLLRADVSDLEQTVWSLVAETAADGPGG